MGLGTSGRLLKLHTTSTFVSSRREIREGKPWSMSFVEMMTARGRLRTRLLEWLSSSLLNLGDGHQQGCRTSYAHRPSNAASGMLYCSSTQACSENKRSKLQPLRRCSWRTPWRLLAAIPFFGWPLLTRCTGAVVWVPGLRRSKAKVRSEAQKKSIGTKASGDIDTDSPSTTSPTIGAALKCITIPLTKIRRRSDSGLLCGPTNHEERCFLPSQTGYWIEKKGYRVVS
jgi:hypothetical protein